MAMRGAAVLAAMMLAALPSVGQEAAPPGMEDDERVVIRGDRITLEVGVDGRILVDGRPVSEGEGPIVLHVNPVDDALEVEALEPQRRDLRMVRSPTSGRRVIRRDTRDHVMHHDGPVMGRLLEDFEVEIPDLEPLMERLHVRIGEPLRESWNEHREVAELERESRELARRARQAAMDNRDELEAELRDKLSEIFDKKIELREDTVERLQERAEEERLNADRRRSAREQIIERRMRTLLGEEDVLDW